MTEYERMAAGLLYNDGEPQMMAQRKRAAELCHDYNYHTRPTDGPAKRAILEQLLGSMGRHCSITPPFWCDFGYNIHLGEGFYANHGLNLLDGAPITIGKGALIGPNCNLCAVGHPYDPEERASGLVVSLPITIGDDVWLGANVTVLMGVTIGDGCIIGAGSVVTRDIPAGVIAAGNPCRVIRPLTEADKERYGAPHMSYGE